MQLSKPAPGAVTSDWAATMPADGSGSLCFVCNPLNPRGLHLRFDSGDDGVVAQWLPQADFVSYPGVVHGGIIAAVLDEAMPQAIARCGRPGFRCELEARLRRHVRIGVPMCVRGWVVEKRKRRIVAQARLSSTSGD